jgi:glycosyltransferase involved in cell wall biosynthesis
MVAFSIRVIVVGASESRNPPRVVIGSTVHPAAAFAGWILAVYHRSEFVYEVRDLWPSTLIDLSVVKRNGAADIFLQLLNKFLARRAKAVISPLAGVGDFFREQGIKRPFAWLPNGVDIEIKAPAIRGPKTTKSFAFGYLGSLARIYDWEGVARAIALASQKLPEYELSFHLIGGGTEMVTFRNHLASNGIEKCLINVGPQNEDDLAEYLSRVDALVLPHLNLPVFRYGTSPVKISHYLRAGKPLIYSDADKTRWLDDFGVGFSVNWQDTQTTAEVMVDVVRLSDSELLQIRYNAEQAANLLSWKTIGERLSDFLSWTLLEEIRER